VARQRFTFTEEQCKKFEEEANPAQWLVTAALLHGQALELHARREQGFFSLEGPSVRGK
jgi:hypothetical protein